MRAKYALIQTITIILHSPRNHLFMKFSQSVIAAACLLFSSGCALFAADPAFVGVLSQLSQPEVAKELELSADIQTKLNEIIAEREDAALPLALKFKDLSPAEQTVKMAPFVAESEKLGLALLTDEQKKKFSALQIANQGMVTLGDPKIAEALGLSEKQKQEISAILTARSAELTRGGSEERARARGEYERKLAAVLTPPQKTAWEIEAGLLDPDAPRTDPKNFFARVGEGGEGEGEKPAETPDPKTVAENGGEEKGDKPTGDKPVATTPQGSGKIQFSSRFSPWKDTIEWFAEQSDLALIADDVPPGTFNYSDPKEYTPDEALDLMNGVLQTKGYILIRKQRMLFLINLENEIPPTLIDTISPEELKGRGQHALVRVAFPLDKMTPEQADAELRPLIGEQGDMKLLSASKQVVITDTVGKLRMIQTAIARVDAPMAPSEHVKKIFKPEFSSVDEILTVVRGLLAFPDAEANALPDGTLRFSVDPLTSRIFVSATPEQLKNFEEIFELTDVDTGDLGGPANVETPKLEVYPVTTANPEMAFQVVQTLLAGELDVRVALDEKTGSVVVFANSSQHAIVKATIDQLQKDKRQIEVFTLRRVDPTLALLAINSLFDIGEEADPSAPKVDADPTSAQVFIRGSEDQIRQIRELLEKMGEDLSKDPETAQGSPYRFVPNSPSTEAALRQMETIWPTIRKNKIRVVVPSADSNDREPSPFNIPSLGGARIYEKRSDRDDETEKPTEGEGLPAEVEDLLKPIRPSEDKSTRRRISPSIQFAIYQQPAEEDSKANSEEVAKDEATTGEDPAGEEPKNEEPKELADIVIHPGPGGMYIMSEDVEALEEFMAILEEMTIDAGNTGPEYYVYYLKYVQADVAASLLTQITSGDSGGGGTDGGLIGDLAGDVLGGAGSLLGGLMGGLGTGGSMTGSGNISITPDLRLNALIVQGTPEDQDLIEQLLKILDKKESPEDNETKGKPRLIPVFNQTAEAVAGVIRTTFADNISSGQQGGGQRQPSPEDLIRALRGGGRNGGGGAQQVKQEPAKMTVSVDATSNTLIVRAPDELFDEVKRLVEQLDEIGAAEAEFSYVYQLKGLSPEAMETALSSIIGAGIETSSSTTTSNTSNNSTNQNQRGEQDQQAEVRQRIEQFNAIRRAMEQGRGGQNSGRPGGGPGGGRPGGGTGGGRQGGGPGGGRR